MMQEIVEKIVNGYKLSREEVLEIWNKCLPEVLYEAAHQITQRMMGKGFDTCSIINVKSGNCPEDCKWCAQSRHYTTGAQVYPLLDTEACVAQANYNHAQGIKRFSLVASGRSLSLREIQTLADTYKAIRRESGVRCCASLGLLDEERLRILYEAGVTTYHCNMETAPNFFGKLCTTHSQKDKLETIKAARRVGMRVCSGGIIGMGERMEDRIDFALFLRDIGVYSIPINMLQPIAGTPLASVPPLSPEEYLTTVALFRLINPKAYLRFSGGRIQIPLPIVRKAMYIGINAAITGDMLTTIGVRAEEDMQLIKEMGYSNEIETTWETEDRI
ncbi:biotin synthase BioB [Porphyromonas circumdentaria]|nr:biotin synthase BioB [Porphyromonas circumdentaria]